MDDDGVLDIHHPIVESPIAKKVSVAASVRQVSPKSAIDFPDEGAVADRTVDYEEDGGIMCLVETDEWLSLLEEESFRLNSIPPPNLFGEEDEVVAVHATSTGPENKGTTFLEKISELPLNGSLQPKKEKPRKEKGFRKQRSTDLSRRDSKRILYSQEENIGRKSSYHEHNHNENDPVGTLIIQQNLEQTAENGQEGYVDTEKGQEGDVDAGEPESPGDEHLVEIIRQGQSSKRQSSLRRLHRSMKSLLGESDIEEVSQDVGDELFEFPQDALRSKPYVGIRRRAKHQPTGENVPLMNYPQKQSADSCIHEDAIHRGSRESTEVVEGNGLKHKDNGALNNDVFNRHEEEESLNVDDLFDSNFVEMPRVDEPEEKSLDIMELGSPQQGSRWDEQAEEIAAAKYRHREVLVIVICTDVQEVDDDSTITLDDIDSESGDTQTEWNEPVLLEENLVQQHEVLIDMPKRNEPSPRHQSSTKKSLYVENQVSESIGNSTTNTKGRARDGERMEGKNLTNSSSDLLEVQPVPCKTMKKTFDPRTRSFSEKKGQRQARGGPSEILNAKTHKKSNGGLTQHRCTLHDDSVLYCLSERNEALALNERKMYRAARLEKAKERIRQKQLEEQANLMTGALPLPSREQRIRDVLDWYQRFGFPSRVDLKMKIIQMQTSDGGSFGNCLASPDDVDLLSWTPCGSRVNMKHNRFSEAS